MAKKTSGVKKAAPAIKLIATKRFVGSEGQRATMTLIEGTVSATVSFKVATDEETPKGHVKFARVYSERVTKDEGPKALDKAVKAAVANGWQLTQGRSRAMGVQGEIPEA